MLDANDPAILARQREAIYDLLRPGLFCCIETNGNADIVVHRGMKLYGFDGTSDDNYRAAVLDAGNRAMLKCGLEERYGPDWDWQKEPEGDLWPIEAHPSL